MTVTAPAVKVRVSPTIGYPRVGTFTLSVNTSESTSNSSTTVAPDGMPASAGGERVVLDRTVDADVDDVRAGGGAGLARRERERGGEGGETCAKGHRQVSV